MEAQTANLLIAASLLLATPFFVIFGTLSGQDRPQAGDHGRPAARLASPISRSSRDHPLRQPGARDRRRHGAGHRRRRSQRMLVPVQPGTARRSSPPPATSPRRRLSRRAWHYSNEAAAAGTPATVKVGATTVTFGTERAPTARHRRSVHQTLGDTITAAVIRPRPTRPASTS